MKKVIVLLICAALCTAAFAGTAFAKTERKTDVIYAPVDESTHEKISETWDYPVMRDGTLGSGKRVGEVVTIEEHRFEDGVCIMCEYEPGMFLFPDSTVKHISNGTARTDVASGIASGAASEAASEAASDTASGAGSEKAADAAPQAAADGFTVGLSAARNRIAVRTLKAVFETLGPGETVRLVDAEAVLTADEAEALARLEAREQVLVLLAAMGYDIGETLSDDARALLAKIQMRATPRALRDAFPAETLAIDGGEADCFVLTLAFTSAGGEVLEHYAFRKDSGAFVRMTIEG